MSTDNIKLRSILLMVDNVSPLIITPSSYLISKILGVVHIRRRCLSEGGVYFETREMNCNKLQTFVIVSFKTKRNYKISPSISQILWKYLNINNFLLSLFVYLFYPSLEYITKSNKSPHLEVYGLLEGRRLCETRHLLEEIRTRW